MYSMFVPSPLDTNRGLPYDTILKGLDDDRGTKGLPKDASMSHFKKSTG